MSSKKSNKKISQKKLQANCRNAKLSKGPKTKEGKAKSKMNALKHGLTAKELILPGENEKQFKELRKALKREYKPETATQQVCFRQVVQSAWCLLRAAKADPFIIKGVLQEQGVKKNEVTEDAICGALVRSITDGKLTNLARYQTSLTNAFYKAVAEMRKAKDD